KLEDFLSGVIQVYGPDLLRYKGVLFMKGSDRQTVFQGVHMMMRADTGRRWQPGEKRGSRMVFIGRNLPQETIVQGLEQCLACSCAAPGTELALWARSTARERVASRRRIPALRFPEATQGAPRGAGRDIMAATKEKRIPTEAELLKMPESDY